MSDLLSQLKDVTTVVVDSGDLGAIEQFRPVDATTNPSLLLNASQLDFARPMLASAISYAKAHASDKAAVLELACDKFAVDVGTAISKLVPGRVSTEVDARLSFDTAATVAKALQLIELYQQNGISTERILIKIASTWEGIQAARQLEQQGIQCNLTLLFHMAQARACAEAGAYLISPLSVVFSIGTKPIPSRTIPPRPIRACCRCGIFITFIKNMVTPLWSWAPVFVTPAKYWHWPAVTG